MVERISKRRLKKKILREALPQMEDHFPIKSFTLDTRTGNVSGHILRDPFGSLSHLFNLRRQLRLEHGE